MKIKEFKFCIYNGDSGVAISDGVWSSAYCKGWLPVAIAHFLLQLGSETATQQACKQAKVGY